MRFHRYLECLSDYKLYLETIIFSQSPTNINDSFFFWLIASYEKPILVIRYVAVVKFTFYSAVGDPTPSPPWKVLALVMFKLMS